MPHKRSFPRGALYVLLTSGFAKCSLEEAAVEAIRGGADVLQLREKNMPDRELLALARRIREVTRASDRFFIVNDRPDIAVLADADGAHVGQLDLPPRAARQIVGPERIVGVSTHAIEEALAAAMEGADYLGVGPLFPTSTKGYERGVGPEYVRRVRERTNLCLIAIGGINLENLGEALNTGVDGVAVCSAILGAKDICAATKAFKDRITDHFQKHLNPAPSSPI